MNVDDMTRQIDERLAELREEVGRLEQARSALTGTVRGRRRGRPRAAATSDGRRGRRRGSGTRSLQALELVKENPGITIPELADRMGIKQNYLYRVMPTLAGEGKVRKQDKGWVPAGEPGGPSPDQLLDGLALLGELVHRGVDALAREVVDLQALDDLPLAARAAAGEAGDQTLLDAI